MINPEFPRIPEVTREQKVLAVCVLIDGALQELAKRFDTPSNPLDHLPYHNRAHTEVVLRNIVTINSAIRETIPGFNEWQESLTSLAGSFHDIEQRWEPLISTFRGTPITIRKRLTGVNEIASADTAATAMEQSNRTNPGLFTADDERLVRDAIVSGTTTAYDPATRTVRRPLLTSASPPATRILALADFGSVGMAQPKDTLRIEDALFREDNIDIGGALSDSESFRSLDTDLVRDRILAWTESRASFFSARKSTLPSELEGFPRKTHDIALGLFSQFDELIQAAEQYYQRRRSLPFVELMRDIGYAVPT